jgi:hypothetical protein
MASNDDPFMKWVVNFYHSAGKNLPENCRLVDHMVAITLISTHIVTLEYCNRCLKITFYGNGLERNFIKKILVPMRTIHL